MYHLTQQVNMLKALSGICFLHLTTIVLLFIAVIDDAWWFTRNMYTDIWGRWAMGDGEFEDEVWVYTDLPTSYRKDYLQAVQAFAVLSCLFAVVSLFVFIYQLFTLGKGERFTLSGVLQLTSGFCIMVALSIYTDHFHRDEPGGWYGYSYILAWFGFLLALLTGVIYVILRKRME
ncbi:epithelial membrane protein 1 isoform X2 [Denticeps clupeoides]|uniref:Epithelial membrane protein 1 n=1 Tax=Denticeps clupeoides TaxID=299321 RepID=A0AAY4AHL7_9TELE|nr:peripheral myelin protein 22-like isoform X2 [Denticeps clupeoides]